MNVLIELLKLFVMILDILIWLLVAQAILSWLVAFNVVNMHNGFVRSVVFGLDRLFQPMLRPIRRIMPDLGGIDLSPMLLVLFFILLQRLVPAILLDTGMI